MSMGVVRQADRRCGMEESESWLGCFRKRMAGSMRKCQGLGGDRVETGSPSEPRWATWVAIGLWISVLPALGAAGALDLDFETGSGADDIIRALAREPSGSLLVGGSFRRFNTNTCHGLVRLDVHGVMAGAFVPNSDGLVNAIQVLANGQILAGGNFSMMEDVSLRHLARLEPDGRVDPAFTPLFGDSDSVWALAVQRDGRILVGGDLTELNHRPMGGLVRLLATGLQDPEFAVQETAGGMVSVVVLQPDQRILVGGNFESMGSTRQRGLIRLQPDGTPDSGFAAELEGSWTEVATIVVQPDDKILIGGRFERVHGKQRHGIARLHSTGALDESFATSGGLAQPYDQVRAMGLSTAGRVWIGGSFHDFEGSALGNFVRLLPDGSLDPEFRPCGGVNGSVEAVVVEPDGRAVVAGDFGSVNHLWRGGIARVSIGAEAGGEPPCSLQIHNTGHSLRLVVLSEPGQVMALRASTDLILWDEWVESRWASTPFELSLPTMALGSRHFFSPAPSRIQNAELDLSSRSAVGPGDGVGRSGRCVGGHSFLRPVPQRLENGVTQ